MIRKNKIDHISGYGTLIGTGGIEVKAEGRPAEMVRAKHIILATGARPRTIPGIAIDRRRIISSTEAMNLTEQPKSMIIIGAGAIGIEFAYFYNALGTKVTVVEMMPTILPVEDGELTKMMESSLKKQGIEILTQTKVESVKPGANDVAVVVSTSDGKKELKGDVALMAIGVQGNVENLGL
ncbi:MAG: hypothetical protein HW412_1057, partial [Bacteroidetes bacterium]|nr:hypothetical protein [Bacteroidota bacterium]